MDLKGGCLEEYFSPIAEQLKSYLANFIPYVLEGQGQANSEQQMWEQLDVYEQMYE